MCRRRFKPFGTRRLLKIAAGEKNIEWRFPVITGDLLRALAVEVSARPRPARSARPRAFESGRRRTAPGSPVAVARRGPGYKEKAMHPERTGRGRGRRRPGGPGRRASGRPRVFTHFRVPSPQSRPQKTLCIPSRLRTGECYSAVRFGHYAYLVSGLRPRGPPPPGSRLRPPGGGTQTRRVRRPKRRIGARTSSRCLLQRMVIRARW